MLHEFEVIMMTFCEFQMPSEDRYYVNIRGKSEYIKLVTEVRVRILCDCQKPD